MKEALGRDEKEINNVVKKTFTKTADAVTTHENKGKYKKISDLYVAGSLVNINIPIDSYISSQYC